MLQYDLFKRLIVCKAFMLVLIIIWGGSVQISNANNLNGNTFTDLGGLVFFIFSIVYFFVSYQLYIFKSLGKRLFVPVVFLFILLGFLSEFINPIEVNKNLFYLFIFYIVSPLFFVVQGAVAAMLYFTNVSANFDRKTERS